MQKSDAMDIWIWIGALAAIVIGIVYYRFTIKKRGRPESFSVVDPAPKSDPGPAALSRQLKKTRGAFFGKLGQLFESNATFSDFEWEKIEDVLLAADVGTATVKTILDRVKSQVSVSNGSDLKGVFKKEALALLKVPEAKAAECPKPYVISIVGVNGAGKTTTIGKLAHLFKSEGKQVLLGAADTFRAAAISQLKIWADRVQVPIVCGKEGGDPGAVSFDTVTSAKAKSIDVVLLDTAGRLHTKTNLMEELKKIHRVIKKVIPKAPHETWLIMDGTTGQNAIQQAREFKKSLDVTGVIVTKLDGTAKGGALFSIVSELKLPVLYIGIGEAMEDLIAFNPENFVDAILN